MEIINNKQYLAVLDRVQKAFPFWEQLTAKTILLSGATGMIGSFLVDLVMFHNQELLPENVAVSLHWGVTE